jgi:hypothetical protein
MLIAGGLLHFIGPPEDVLLGTVFACGLEPQPTASKRTAATGSDNSNFFDLLILTPMAFSVAWPTEANQSSRGASIQVEIRYSMGKRL